MPLPDLNTLISGRLQRRHLVPLDVVAAATYLAVLLPPALASGHGADSREPVAVRCLVVVLLGVPLCVRRLWPRPVFVLVVGVTLFAAIAGADPDAFTAAAFALYPVALESRSARLVPTWAIGLVGYGIVVFGVLGGSSGGPAIRVGPPVVGAALLVLVWSVGYAVRERRRHLAREAVRSADQAVADERLRIARELHDVVSHSMGLIAVKAGVANHVLAQRPAEAAEALQIIESVSRDALTEMRSILRVLRPQDPDGDCEMTPAPGLSEIADLVDGVGDSGVRIHLSLDIRQQVPDGIGLAGYRIVQEALTNVIKHAAPTTCKIRVTTSVTELRIDVVDKGRAPHTQTTRRQAPGDGGHGLVGMRERVLLYGGTLDAGPEPGGGFWVRACLPVGPDEALPDEAGPKETGPKEALPDEADPDEVTPSRRAENP